MNKSKYFSGTLLAIVLMGYLFQSCNSEEWATFDSKFSYISFVNNKISINEKSEKIVPIIVGASGTAGQLLTVDYEILLTDSTDGYKTAKEGVDFIILDTDRTLRFEKGVGYDTIYIKTINNAVKDGHVAFRITMKDNNLGYARGFNGNNMDTEVIVLDDESSSKFEGSWEVSGKTVWYQSSTGQLKATSDTTNNETLAFATYIVSIVTHPTEPNTLLIKNFMNQRELTVTMTTNEIDTIAMQTGQIGQIKGFDIFFGGFDDDGEDTGNLPVIGEILDENTFRFCRYMSYYYRNGELLYTGPTATVLKSTWKKLD